MSARNAKIGNVVAWGGSLWVVVNVDDYKNGVKREDPHITVVSLSSSNVSGGFGTPYEYRSSFEYETDEAGDPIRDSCGEYVKAKKISEGVDDAVILADNVMDYVNNNIRKMVWDTDKWRK